MYTRLELTISDKMPSSMTDNMWTKLKEDIAGMTANDHVTACGPGNGFYRIIRKSCLNDDDSKLFTEVMADFPQPKFINHHES
jgi:hypothetical protein